MTNEMKTTEMDQITGGISPVPVPTTMPNPRHCRSIVDPSYIIDPGFIIDPGYMPRPGQPSPEPGPAPVSRRR